MKLEWSLAGTGVHSTEYEIGDQTVKAEAVFQLLQGVWLFTQTFEDGLAMHKTFSTFEDGEAAIVSAWLISCDPANTPVTTH